MTNRLPLCAKAVKTSRIVVKTIKYPINISHQFPGNRQNCQKKREVFVKEYKKGYINVVNSSLSSIINPKGSGIPEKRRVNINAISNGVYN
jgi:hypothetical protein